MSALIRSMLEITRLDQGTQKVNWEYADLSDLVTVICDEQAMVARRGIRISCAAEPGIFIDMDVFLISRVVQNLLDNAFKFGVDGGWIHVTLRRAAAGAELTVQDNGIGISQENLDKNMAEVLSGRPQPAGKRRSGPGPVDGAADRHAPRRHGRRREYARPRHDVHGHAARTPRKRGKLI